jgi:hypothetical protein
MVERCRIMLPDSKNDGVEIEPTRMSGNQPTQAVNENVTSPSRMKDSHNGGIAFETLYNARVCKGSSNLSVNCPKDASPN